MEIALFTAISFLVLNLSFQPGKAMRISETKKEHKMVEVLLKDNRFDSRQADRPCSGLGDECTRHSDCCSPKVCTPHGICDVRPQGHGQQQRVTSRQPESQERVTTGPPESHCL